MLACQFTKYIFYTFSADNKCNFMYQTVYGWNTKAEVKTQAWQFWQFWQFCRNFVFNWSCLELSEYLSIKINKHHGGEWCLMERQKQKQRQKASHYLKECYFTIETCNNIIYSAIFYHLRGKGKQKRNI